VFHFFIPTGNVKEGREKGNHLEGEKPVTGRYILSKGIG